ncbi:diguanylate cyclase [Chloroflexus sp.]|uniref:sensor domain-containing diguanylate cyclase n=1 Tax=Chloroflexus sp. TaxID=1904827 RepID=UPI002ACDC81C|nr:diguanylate cyclase [Chloroflexus sp.]
MAVWIVDQDYRLIYANTAFRTKPPAGFPINSQSGDRALPDPSAVEDYTQWTRSYERALNGETITITIGATSYSVQPLQCLQGGTLAVITTAAPSDTDSATLFRTAIETMPDPFGVYVAVRNLPGQIVDARITVVNAAMCSATGYRREELLNQRLLDLFPHYANDGTFADVRRLIETGAPIRRTTTIVKPSGEQRYVEVHAGKLNDGFVAIWHDIHDQHQLNRRIRQQAELLNQIADAVIATDLNYTVISWNRGAEQIYGWTEEEVIGKRLQTFFETRFSDTTRDEAAAILRETGRWEGEIEQRRRDGKYIPIHSIVVLIRDEYGTPTGIVAVNRDISERRHFEMLLMKANQRLESAMVEARRQAAEILMVNELHDLLQVCQTINEAAGVIAFSLQRIFPHQSGYLMVRQPGTANLNLVASWGATTTAPPSLTIDQCWALRRGLIHRTCAGEGLRCAHIRTHPDDCTCCVPLVVQGEIYGLIHIAGSELPRSELIVMTGDTIKLALSNLELRTTLREQAIIDPLTGLYNRRYLESSLPRELHRAQREQVPLTVAMIDIDHFKQFNDQYGHDAGDVLLRELAIIFREHLRQSDLACRYGGEEFVLILPGINRATAQTRLQRLRETVQRRQIAFAGQLLGPITISIGFVVCESADQTMHLIIQHADTALYTAKRSGRNQVVDFAELNFSPSNEGNE